VQDADTNNKKIRVTSAVLTALFFFIMDGPGEFFWIDCPCRFSWYRNNLDLNQILIQLNLVLISLFQFRVNKKSMFQGGVREP